MSLVKLSNGDYAYTTRHEIRPIEGYIQDSRNPMKFHPVVDDCSHRRIEDYAHKCCPKNIRQRVYCDDRIINLGDCKDCQQQGGRNATEEDRREEVSVERGRDSNGTGSGDRSDTTEERSGGLGT